MALSIIQIFRDYVTNGIPSSGNHKPAKSEIRSWGAWVESIISSFLSNGGLVYTSRAALFADLAHAANSSAWVIGDATAAYNGVYMKAGASGTGSWTRVADLPYSFVQLVDAGAGTANAIQLTSTIPTSQSVLRVANVFEANAGNVTISENGGTARPLLTNSGNQISAGGLLANMMIVYVDDGVSFRLLSDQVSAAIVAAAEGFANAAASSASDAADSAAAAAASAAGVDLPPIASDRMLVDNAAGTVRESKTFSEVRTLLSTAAFPADTGLISRSDLDRLGEVVNVADYTAQGAARTGILAAWTEALSQTRAVVFLPPGRWVIDTASLALLMDSGSAKHVTICGAGKGVTTLAFASTGNWLELGSRTTTNIGKNVTLRDLRLEPNATQSTGTAIVVEKFQYVTVKDIHIEDSRQFFKIGDPNVANDVYRMWVSGVYGKVLGSSYPTSAILLQSGSILTFDDACDFNGNGSILYLFGQENAANNFDGLTVGGITAEMFGLLNVTGKGMSNTRFHGGISDRPTNNAISSAKAVNLVPSSSGNIFNLSFVDWKFQGNAASNSGVVLNTAGAGGLIDGLSMIGCQAWSFGNQILNTDDSGAYSRVIIAGNSVWNCGYGGTPLFRVGTGKFNVYGNQGIVTGGVPGYTYGITWNGTSGGRVTGLNNFTGFTTGAELGTP
ncbi:hypothetical protein HFN71_28785 [Rhizobium laguerreae]|uniref:glycoside hydrolase family 55 protein n=1 Tax=Rhizobium laguerreae TaxID=1076926 RepID=UPI001C91F528|nr:glycoside hydrolase family 55 protein [Rhizobium laguerreae]MBY3543681.1 hypothetical protein [Rhizobium laguerreae]